MSLSGGSARRARLVAVALALLAASGCGEESRVDPDATVVLAGEVRAAGGQPLGGRPVRLVSSSDGGELAAGFLTLGLACAGDACDDDVRDTQTDDAGRYRLELAGRDTQTSFGNVRQQALSVSAAPRATEVSGASVTARFVVQAERLDLPALQLVDPALTLGAAPGRVGASWRTAAAGPYVLTFETDDLVPVWQVTTGGPSATVDGRVLEGTAGRVVLAGGSTDEVVGSEVALTWRSPGTGYASAAGAPLSRGLPCSYGPGQVADGCGVTDGDLFVSQLPPACTGPASPAPATPPPCDAPTSVAVDLTRPAPTELVVVRGCVGSCVVEVSGDGSSYRPVGTVTGPFGAVRLPLVDVRAVRVGLGRDGLREVSVWGPAGPGPALQPVGADDLADLRAPYDSGEVADSRLAVLLAAALAAAGLLGVGYLAGQRRRPAVAA